MKDFTDYYRLTYVITNKKTDASFANRGEDDITVDIICTKGINSKAEIEVNKFKSYIGGIPILGSMDDGGIFYDKNILQS